MSDISDNEEIEKPKRQMSETQKEALRKGRELAKANREARKKEILGIAKKELNKPKAEAEVEEEVKQVKKRESKKPKAETSPQVVVEQKKKPLKNVVVVSQEEEVTPPPTPVKRERKPRTPRTPKAPPKPSIVFM
jgi:hypothetical protein